MIEKYNISDEEIVSVTEAIEKRTGIDFNSYEKSSLKRGFSRLLSKHHLKSMLDLWQLIMKDREIITSLVDDLTVNLTDLFRNDDMWVKVGDEILPTFKDTPVIRILHAGCSSGEEVYSMAMILQHRGELMKSRLTAYDLSTKMIETASAGRYPANLMRKYKKAIQDHFPGTAVEEFFDEDDEGFAVFRSSLKRTMKFQQMNLVTGDFGPMKQNIVFFRNVMIYFDDGLKLKVLEKLHASMASNSFLIIGYYDTFPQSAKHLFEPYHLASKIYKKI